jgi:hypothetical protein
MSSWVNSHDLPGQGIGLALPTQHLCSRFKCPFIPKKHQQLLLKQETAFTVPDTLEIIRTPESAICQNVTMAAYKFGLLLSIYALKKQKEKITCKNLGQ